MSYQTIFKRYELKYLMTREQQAALMERMEPHMTPDAFGKGTISNVYWDTPDKRLIRRSLEKPCYKEKLRVRSYGVATPDTPVFVELKKKYKGVVYKRRMALTEHIASGYLGEGVPLEGQGQIGKEIDYFLSVYGTLEPSAFLSYEREAFFSKTDEQFRMTFDENILCRTYDLSLVNGIYGEEILPQGKVLLEVKTALGIPAWLLDFLSESKLYKTSFSKYGRAYQQLILPVKWKGGEPHVA